LRTRLADYFVKLGFRLLNARHNHLLIE
jgi:hypothetical protein